MANLFTGVSLVFFLIAAALAAYWRWEQRKIQAVFDLQRDLTYILEPALSLEQAAPQVLEALCRHCGFDAGCLFLEDSESRELRCRATWTMSVACQEFCGISANLVFAAGTGFAGAVLQSNQVLVVTDLSREHSFARAASADRAGLRSAVLVPVILDGEGVAVVELYRTKFSEHCPMDSVLLRVAERLALLLKREISQRQLVASEVELRSVIDTAPDGIVYVDSHGRIESVNKAAANLLGYAREEMIGKVVFDFLPDEYRKKLGTSAEYYFRNSIEALVGRATEVTGQRKDGTLFPMELSIGRLMVADREIFTGIIRDITDRKQMEKRVSQFYSTISHELRSPLSSIRGSLGLIEGGAVGEVSAEVIELVQIAKKNCDRLIRLINDILDAKKIEAGMLQMESEVLEPEKIISAAIEGLQAFAAESKVALVAASTDSPSVIGDEDRIVQVLTNLLSNAIKYSPAGAQVNVYTDRASNGENFVRFCVLDHGPGIRSDELTKLFSEFQQLDASDSRAKGGTGLGLAISKNIVEQLGGQIGVDNRPGKGATFWFELPRKIDG